MVTRRTERMVQRTLLMGGAGVLVLLTLALGYSTYRVYTKMAVVAEERVHAEDERAELTARNAELTAALASLETDRGVEAEIRTRYPLVKQGEVEFVIVEEAGAATVGATTTEPGFWELLSSWFTW